MIGTALPQKPCRKCGLGFVLDFERKRHMKAHRHAGGAR